MALEGFLDSNGEMAIPLVFPTNGDGGIFQALNSANSRKEHLDSILRMAHLNANLTSDALLSTVLGKSSTPEFSLGRDSAVVLSNSSVPTGAYLLTHGSASSMEPYVCLPSSPMSLNGSPEAQFFSQLCQGGQQSRKRQYVENTAASVNLSNQESHFCLNSLPVRMKQETGTLAPFHKKTKFDINQEVIQQQIIQDLLMKDLQDRNPQLKAMIELHRQQNQQLQQPNLLSLPELTGIQLQLPKEQTRQLLQDQGNQQVPSPPMLDGDICCRRFMQYLYHLRNHPNDNNIAYWRNFVSEYYAPCSKKRWCFSMYGNIERHATGVFCPKSMETWCCELCSSRSGKGLEASFDIFPRLFKTKYESGMLDEFLFLDLPLARRSPSGLLVLEYRKAIQESIYEKFRVVHEGKLRVVFRNDLKILSWEFCAQKHDEFLLRRLVAPQVDQFLQGAQKYENAIRNGARVTVQSGKLQSNCDMFVAAGHKLAREMEIPLVNDLGYPKKYIRCLQISEVVNSMKDLISFSHVSKVGPIESLNKHCQPSNIDHMRERQEMQQLMVARNLLMIPGHPSPQRLENIFGMTGNGQPSGSRNSDLALANLSNQLPGQNTSIASASRKQQESRPISHSNLSTGFNPQSFYSNDTSYTSERSPLTEYCRNPHQLSERSRNPHQVLTDKLLRDMVASSRGKSANGMNKQTATSQSNRAAFGSALVGRSHNHTAYNERLGETSNAGSAQRNSGNGTRTENFPEAASRANLSAASRGITIKIEPHSPEKLQNLANGICKVEDIHW